MASAVSPPGSVWRPLFRRRATFPLPEAASEHHTPASGPRVSTLATPHTWLRSSLPCSAGLPPGSAAIGRARAHAHAHAHARTRTRTCMHTLARMFARFRFHFSLFALLVLLTHVVTVWRPVRFKPPHSQPRALRHTTVLSNISCPYRSVCGTDAACSSNTIRDSR